MAKDEANWDLESLIDFEQRAASETPTPPSVRQAVAAATRGHEGAAARRIGLRVWLAEMPPGDTGRRSAAALGWVTTGLAAVVFFAGVSATLGMLDRTLGGVNVTLFLAILIGGQWLVLAAAAVAWLVRCRAADGFSMVQAAVAGLVRRIAGKSVQDGWSRLMDGGAAPRAAVLWRIARSAQTAGIFFNLGILGGLAGLVLLKNVGFFWETTTAGAMRSGLGTIVNFLSTPWAAWLPESVPGGAVIDATRRLPGNTAELAPGPPEWWRFLLMTTLVWGLLPRAVLWLLAWQASRRALAKLDFQARHHRTRWREITGPDRAVNDDPPLDGVLVLDVGGSSLTEQRLRPFLLTRLRVHPTAWKPVAVLDEGAEEEASRSLTKAPAGVVLLAEGWALSPPRMTSLHRRIRAAAGQETPVKFLVANVGPEGEPTGVTEDERREWARFVDSLRDPAAEVFFFETDQRGL